MEIEVYFNEYKGSGKHWVAEIDRNNQIIKFLKPKRIEYDKSQYKGIKIYDLENGKRYMINEAHTGSYDLRQIVSILNDKLDVLNKYEFNSSRYKK
ncbi:hypothetical protein THYS13_13710 [Thermoanaerobacter sp. YS13]|uniref:hypothetical protein n=1 Tax=Thermoanaerobacter sp. YS13 TaxID=1511746 RepID=UPI0005736D29|nr:hypothetical protein [Thermoanaerobacter sp. YS13]KHO63250.1 hypothetical protein THYS13_13710 [Thermoanaerobacter sp. YS13]